MERIKTYPAETLSSGRVGGSEGGPPLGEAAKPLLNSNDDPITLTGGIFR